MEFVCWHSASTYAARPVCLRTAIRAAGTAEDACIRDAASGSPIAGTAGPNVTPKPALTAYKACPASAARRLARIASLPTDTPSTSPPSSGSFSTGSFSTTLS